MKIDWKFPLANHGSENGGNDSGVYTFAGNKFWHLGKEIIQNSMDACKDEKTVIVEFSSFQEKTSDMLGYSELLNAMKKCCDAAEENSTKIKDSFEKSLELLKCDTVEVLKISDYNTIGLSEPNSTKGGFTSLVKANGKSNKPSNAGGSYGIGKNVVYAISDLKTAYFSSLNENGELGFQGCAKLISYPEGDDYTSGTGFYGRTDKCQAIIKESYIPQNFLRDKPGTDIYVYGFNKREGWEDEIKKSIIENFFISITKNKLKIKINDFEINSNNIQDLIQDSYSPNDLLYQYYTALTTTDNSEDKRLIKRKYSFKGVDYGNVELHLYKQENFSNKVAIVRNNGMKIYDKKYRSVSKFSGVFLIHGSELNEYIKMMENPEHNKLLPELVENFKGKDSKHAKLLLKDLYENFIRKEFRELVGTYKGEKLEIQSLSQFLPSMLSKEKKKVYETKKESGKKIPTKIKITKLKTKPSLTDFEDDSDPGTKKGTLGSKGGGRKGQQPRKRKTKLSSRIVYIASKDKYRATVNVNKSKEAYISFNILTEDGKENKCQLSEINVLNSLNQNISLNKEKNSYGPIYFEEGKNSILEFKLKEKGKYSMEVNINEVGK